MKKSSRLQSKYLKRLVFLVSSKGTDFVTPRNGKETEGKGGDFGDEPFSINQSTYPSKLNLAILSPSSSAVTHVGPGQGLLSLLVPLQWWVPPERVVTLWLQVETGPSKIVRVLSCPRCEDGQWSLLFRSWVSSRYWLAVRKKTGILAFVLAHLDTILLSAG